MGKLIYSLNVSLDGYVETPDHSLDWATVDEELHFWFNEQARQQDASIYGRRMYELMADYWPTADSDPSATPAEVDFAGIWKATPKLVFSSSLESVAWNSRLVRGRVQEEFAKIRAEFSGDLDIGGATLAASFIRAGLVDEYRLLVHPVVIGAGTPFWPELDSPLRLRLLETHRFESGVVFLRYADGR
jgi:dihydrofolate reductase